MELRNFSIEQYKGYTEWANVALAPLTILVGPHNCGKTALAQAIQLLVGGLAPLEKDTSAQRAEHLLRWLHCYNWHRPHDSLKAKTPISRLGLSGDNLLRFHT